MKKPTIALILVLSALSGRGTKAEGPVVGGVTTGCVCMQQSLASEYEKSDLVFAGRALGLTDDGKSIRFQVVKGWKGVMDPTVLINYEPRDKECITSFGIGGYYLVFALKGDTTRCNRTKWLNEAAVEITNLPPPTYINPGYKGEFPPHA